MAIEFVCPACGGTLQVSDESAGRVVRCGGCMTMLRVPESATASAGSTAPASPFETDNQYSAAPMPSRRTRQAYEPTPSEPRTPAPRGDEDADRSRVRRRRRPPEPPGRGIFFWLVVIGAVMLLGVVTCCGGIFLLLPGPQWHTHESKKGGFKVELPAPPQKNMKANALKQEAGLNTEGTILAGRMEVYAVSYRDIPPDARRGIDEEKVLDERVKQLREDRNHVRAIMNEKPITVNGFAGREIEFRGADGGTYGVRVIVAGSRVYQLIGGGQFSKPDNPNVRRFLDSFEITEEKLVAEGKRRIEQAKLAAEAVRQAQEREKQRQIEREQEQVRETAEIVGEDVWLAGIEERLHVFRVQEEARRLAPRVRTAAVTAAGVSLGVAEQELAVALRLATVRDAAASVAGVIANTFDPRLPVAPPPRPVDE